MPLNYKNASSPEQDHISRKIPYNFVITAVRTLSLWNSFQNLQFFQFSAKIRRHDQLTTYCQVNKFYKQNTLNVCYQL